MSQTPIIQEGGSENNSQHQGLIPKIRSLEQERQMIKFAKSESSTPRGLNASNLNFNPGRALNNSQLIGTNEIGTASLKKSQYALVEDLESRWESIKQQSSNMTHSGLANNVSQAVWNQSGGYTVANTAIYQAAPTVLFNQEVYNENFNKQARLVGESPQTGARQTKFERQSPADFNFERKSGRLSIGQQDLPTKSHGIAMINKSVRGNISATTQMYSSQICAASNGLTDGNRSRSGSPALRDQQIKSKEALMQTPVNAREQRIGNLDKNSYVNTSNNFNSAKGPMTQNLIKKMVPHSKIDLASVCLMNNDPRGNFDHLNQSPGPQSSTISPQRNTSSSLSAKLTGRASVNENIQHSQNFPPNNSSIPTNSVNSTKTIRSSNSMSSTASIKKSCLKEKLPPNQASNITTNSYSSVEKLEPPYSSSTQKKPKSLKESSHLKAIFDKYSNISHKKSPDQCQIGKLLKMNDLVPPANEKENNENRSIPVVSRINSNNLSNLTTTSKNVDTNSPKRTVPQPIAPSSLPQQSKDRVVLAEREMNILITQNQMHSMQSTLNVNSYGNSNCNNQKNSFYNNALPPNGVPQRSSLAPALSNSQVIANKVESRVFHHQRQTSSDSTSKGKLSDIYGPAGLREGEFGSFVKEETLLNQRALGEIKNNPPVSYSSNNIENRQKYMLTNSRIAYKENNPSVASIQNTNKSLKDSSFLQDKILSIFNMNEHGLANHTPLFADNNMKFN